MGLNIKRRSWTNSDGTTTSSWRFVIEEYSKGKIRSVYPKKAQYARYGFNPDDSYEQALEKLKTIRARDKVEKTALRRSKIDRRLTEEDLKESAHLPRELYKRFTVWLSDRRLWGEIPSKSISHLRCMRRLILDLDIDPSEWPDHPEKIYRWFMKNRFSVSYLDKVLPILNEYGYFYCKEFRKPFLRIPFPRGDLIRKIEDANLEERNGRQAASAPMTDGKLQKLSDLPEEQFRWLRFSFYFGLRPSELDELTPEKRGTVWDTYKDSKKKWILKIYQKKLTAVERQRRWKRIPAILPEQVKLIKELAEKSPLRRPVLKTVQVRIGAEYGLYAGRKGFEKLMRANGQKFQNISRWLGHSDLQRTERNYREIEAVEYDRV